MGVKMGLSVYRLCTRVIASSIVILRSLVRPRVSVPISNLDGRLFPVVKVTVGLIAVMLQLVVFQLMMNVVMGFFHLALVLVAVVVIHGVPSESRTLIHVIVPSGGLARVQRLGRRRSE